MALNEKNKRNVELLECFGAGKTAAGNRWSFRSLHCRLIDSIKSKIFFHQLPLVVHRSITDSRIRNEIKTIKIRLHSSPGQRQMKAKMMEWNCLKNNGMEFSCAEGWAPAITHQLPNSSSPAFHLLHLLSANWIAFLELWMLMEENY